MFTEIQNPKTPKLQHPNFLVDYKLKDKSPPFPNMHSYIVFLGASRSGKTSLLLSILHHRKLYKGFLHDICSYAYSFIYIIK